MELEIQENPKEISEKEKTGVVDAPVKGCLDEGSTPSGSTKLVYHDVEGVTAAKT